MKTVIEARLETVLPSSQNSLENLFFQKFHSYEMQSASIIFLAHYAERRITDLMILCRSLIQGGFCFFIFSIRAKSLELLLATLVAKVDIF